MTQAECADYVERFAAEYVRKWRATDSAKAQGWAILQAAQSLRSFCPFCKTEHPGPCIVSSPKDKEYMSSSAHLTEAEKRAGFDGK